MRRKTNDESNNNDRDSLEMYTISNQLSRTRQWKRNVSNAIKQRRSVLSRALIGRDDSLIRVNRHERKARNQSDEIVTINISGDRYETRLSTLEAHPNTLLGNEEKRKYYWNNKKNEYFFDRHRACFNAILYYYQSNGRLRRPNYVPLDTFIEEISFFDLGPEAISQVTKVENVSIIKYIDLPDWLWRRYIWCYLEYPQNSIFSKILYLISMILTIVSCVTLAVETLPNFDEKYNIDYCLKPNLTSSLSPMAACVSSIFSPFFIIQTVCVSYFTVEFLLRLISTPSYYKFVLTPLNWIDLGTIVPYYVFLGFSLSRKESDLHPNTLVIFRILRILRFLRVFKLYLIFKQLKTLRVLSSALKESFIDFLIMVVVLTLMAFLFGSALFFAEQDTNGTAFDSIPKATYWGIITIASVGYGDMYPMTITGRILTCLCSLSGLATSAMLVSVLVERYQRVYTRKQFLPDQVMAALHSSDSDDDEKQDFINRKLSGLARTSSGKSIVPLVKQPSEIPLENNETRSSRLISSSSPVRFIISISEDQTNKETASNTANQLMTQLRQTIQTTGEQLNLTLINPENEFTEENQTMTTDRLTSISEENPSYQQFFDQRE